MMLTGDNERTANAVASKLGIGRVIAQVTPTSKGRDNIEIKNKRK